MLPEGRYDRSLPDGARLGVVVLHPHPDMGGDRFNPPVTAIYEACVAAGFATTRFDFSSSDPAIAVDEAHSAIGLLPSGLPVAMAGYSFGAAIATQVCSPAVLGWALVAPPLTMLKVDVDACGADERPKLVLVPEHDQFCPPPEATASTATWVNRTLDTLPGADHFLAGASAAVAARVVEFLSGLVARPA